MDDILPPSFEMDNYTDCIEDQNNLFCNIQASLEFSNTNTTILEYLKNVAENEEKMDPTVIYRGLCMAKNNAENSTFLKTYSMQLVNNTLRKFTSTNLVDVEIVACTQQNTLPLSSYDKILLILFISYTALIIYASFYERTHKNKEIKSTGSGWNYYTFLFLSLLKKLSLYYNWNVRTSTNKNVDFERLLSMQGLRFFLMMGIVFLHVLVINNLSFKSNPIYYENMMHYFYHTFWSFIVLPFFLLSSWLLTLQIYNIMENHGKFSLTNVIITIINRYFRLAVTVALLILVQWSSFIPRSSLLTYEIVTLNYEACQENWLKAFIFAGNFDRALDMCNTVTWYVSADFQIYVINLLVLYIKFKYHLKNEIFYGILLAVACMLHTVFIYMDDGHDIIFNMNVRNLDMSSFRKSRRWVIYYTSTYSIWACSIIGLIFGEIYYKTKKNFFKIDTNQTIRWAGCFFGLPLLALLISSRKSTGLEAVILGSIVKPIYNLGFAIGILGMSRNIGGIVKKIFENKYFVIMGNFTFCTYLTHMLPIIMLHSRHEWPWQSSFYQIILDYILVCFLCWPIGILITLIVEEPGLMIQKKLLPQIKRGCRRENDKHVHGIKATDEVSDKMKDN